MKHILDTKIASEYGVNVAILLEHLAYWIHKNLTNKKHVHDGLCWTYNSLDAFVKQFPYWTRRQIERIINTAEKAGLILKGNYNQVKYDRTVWYALTQKSYRYFEQLQDKELLKHLYLSISPNGEMDFSEWGNGFLQTVTPIPDTKPNTKPYINNKGTSCEVQNLGYTEFDEEKGKKEKSDYSDNHDKTQKNNSHVIEIDKKPTKSDYSYTQTKNRTVCKSHTSYGLKNIQKENIFQIPEQLIQDWIANRKKKRAAVTQTAWSKINKELTKCKEQGIDPVEAFETMVAAGWQSIKVEYFQNQAPKIFSASQWNVDSVMRA